MNLFDATKGNRTPAYQLVEKMATEKPGFFGTWKATEQGLKKIDGLEHFLEICKGLFTGWGLQGFQNCLKKDIIESRFIEIISQVEDSSPKGAERLKLIKLIQQAARNAGLIRSEIDPETKQPLIREKIIAIVNRIFTSEKATVENNLLSDSKAILISLSPKPAIQENTPFAALKKEEDQDSQANESPIKDQNLNYEQTEDEPSEKTTEKTELLSTSKPINPSFSPEPAVQEIKAFDAPKKGEDQESEANESPIKNQNLQYEQKEDEPKETLNETPLPIETSETHFRNTDHVPPIKKK